MTEHTGKCVRLTPNFDLSDTTFVGSCNNCFSFDSGKTFWSKDHKCVKCGFAAGQHGAMTGECYDREGNDRINSVFTGCLNFPILPWDTEFYKKIQSECIRDLNEIKRLLNTSK